MDNYIRCYDNAVTDEFSDMCVLKFENDYIAHEQWPEDKPFFTQINLGKSGMWGDENTYLTDVFTKYVKKYKKDCKIDNNQWPSSFGLEPFRMKRYLPDGQNFPPHVDVNTKQNCTRFLAFFLYLTDNKEGSTIFTNHNVKSSCSKGSLLIFPPNWLYLHSGEKCVEKNKYIVGSYAHYIK
tara:strand:- start:145 stop:687 length:543 start_codon:yes stop_codon:yes gene_type:complete